MTRPLKTPVPASVRARPSGNAWRYARHRGDHRHAQPAPPCHRALPGGARRPAAPPSARQLRADGGNNLRKAGHRQALSDRAVRASCCANCFGADRNGSKNAGRRSWPAERPRSPRTSEPDIVHYEFHVMAQYIPFLRSAWPQAAALSPNMSRGSSPTRSAAHRHDASSSEFAL